MIAIIAILAAILFPVFSQAKMAAKKTSDLSNFRQIGNAITLYASDNDDRTMYVDHSNDYKWFVPLYTYVKSKDVFTTPAYKRHEVVDDEGVTIMPETDYSINGLFSHGESMTVSSDSAKQIVVGLRNIEAADPDYHPWPGAAYQDPNTPDWNDITKYIGADHLGGEEEDWFQERLQISPWNGGSNYSFLDGHAKFIKWTKSIEAPLPGMHNPDRIVEKLL